MLRILFFLLILISFISCGDKTYLPQSTGKTGELLVVINDKNLETEAGKSIKNIFGQYQNGLPQEETVFTVIPFPENAFSKILQRHQNIFIADISSKNTLSSFSVKKNVWAENQLYLKVSAPDDSAFADILFKNRELLLGYFLEIELERLGNTIKKAQNKPVQKQLMDNHQIDLLIPKGYNIVMDTLNFVWLKYDTEKSSGGNMHQVNRNLLLYYQDYTSESMFNLDFLLNFQDSITKKYVQGPTIGSYMKTVEQYPVHKKPFNLNGNYAVELRGLWHLQGDFMGGPFLNYSTVDTTNNKLISMVSFIYAPNFDKREYLRELEAIMRTVHIK
ncbi:MAG: DUF4837 family protein [Bacteroidetes bacterium]|nr:DUF4837 family protein [Bacteroidota bacterium]HET6243319.1 DUF4837 family protein [Bacteroidia bacterium]